MTQHLTPADPTLNVIIDATAPTQTATLSLHDALPISESATRAAADTALQSSINTEATNRALADVAEAAARANADTRSEERRVGEESRARTAENGKKKLVKAVQTDITELMKGSCASTGA